MIYDYVEHEGKVAVIMDKEDAELFHAFLGKQFGSKHLLWDGGYAHLPSGGLAPSLIARNHENKYFRVSAWCSEQSYLSLRERGVVPELVE
jgi:hypothetical protein